MKQFFGRENNIELRIGGAFEIYFVMENPAGLRGSEGCVILSYLPEKMLSFTWNAPPQFPEIRNHPHKTWVVVMFTSLDAAKTRIELYHTGWLNGGKWDEVYAYFNQAWEIVLQNLSAACNQGG